MKYFIANFFMTFRGLWILLLTVCFLGLTAPASAADYMSELMEEADDLTVDKSNTVKESELKRFEENTGDESWNYDEQTLGTCEPGMTHAQFEKNLKRNYFVTYKMYHNLDPVSKSLVYKAYQENPAIENITRVIAELAR